MVTTLEEHRRPRRDRIRRREAARALDRGAGARAGRDRTPGSPRGAGERRPAPRASGARGERARPRSTSSCATARPRACAAPAGRRRRRCATSSRGSSPRRAGSASSRPASTSTSAARDAVAPPGGRALLVLTRRGRAGRRATRMYARTQPGEAEAEVAFAVDGAWQGRGLATTLLAHLADAAAEEGIAVFVAITLPGNHRMIGVFRDSGFPVEVRAHPGELHIRFPTSLTPEGRRRFEARERDAAVAAVAHVLRPSSVLLAAAGAEPGTAGGEALRNLAGGGLHGDAARRAGRGRGSRRRRDGAHASPTSRGSVELAVLALAPDGVLQAARECAAARRRAGARGAAGGQRPGRQRRSSWRHAARPGCGWSGRTASAWSTPTRRSRSTRRSRPRGPPAVASRSPRRAAPSGSPRSTWPRSVASACRRSSRWAPRRTCRATTCSSSGRPTPAPTWCCSTSSRSATRAASDRSPAA